MSITDLLPDRTSSRDLCCPNCHAPLPPDAAFCGSCGERIDKKKDITAFEQDISNRYRITSLIRRRPSVKLYFAFDNQQLTPQGQQRMVAIRDIDCSALDEAGRLRVFELVQQEYDLLRRWQLPYVMHAIDLRYYQGHLYVVAGTAAFTKEGEGHEVREDASRHLYTLQDFLQSGQGLPPEGRAVEWVGKLCLGVERLHRRGVVIGDLDPYTVILDDNSEDAAPWLMISWLSPELRELLPGVSASAQRSYFAAPEALQGSAEARSDVYSLGAILYLLLTGMTPEDAATRNRTRTPHEINSHIHQHISEAVMQALATEPEDRFESAKGMLEALRNPQFRRKPPKKVAEEEALEDVETVRILPLSRKHLENWKAARTQAVSSEISPAVPETPQPETQAGEQHGSAPEVIVETPVPTGVEDGGAQAEEVDVFDQDEQAQGAGEPKKAGWLQRITGVLPAISAGKKETQQAAPQKPSWWQQLKQAILGRQEHVLTAAAIIETPMRVQPDQMYTIRMHIIGRNEPELPSGAKRGSRPAGLSALVYGDTVSIEVRSVLQQSYVYIVQRATVTVPAEGYVAEVTIPMQPLSSTPVGRRDRLHIFFLDANRNQLYEKPFVVEVFVSQHVRRGQEGHHVLTIPV